MDSTRGIARRDTRAWSVRAVAARDLLLFPAWRRSFQLTRKDSRYFKILQESIDGGFEHHCFVVEDELGQPRAFQPFFMLDQDLVAGAPPFLQKMLDRARRFLPRLLKARTLMIGCAAGEGCLDISSPGEAAALARLLRDASVKHARRCGASLVVMKEFPASYRSDLACFRDAGFARVPSMPMTRLNIRYDSFDHYMSAALSHSMRKNLRRKFRDAERSAPISLEVCTDITPIVDELYPLYLQVYERSTLHFEKLTKSFLCRLGKEMPDRARFFVWRQNGRAIAFSACLVHEQTLYDEYIGLDYSVALDLHLYFYTLRDIMSWAIAQKLDWYVSTALNYDPKLHLKHELVPLDLYVRHTSKLANSVLRRILPYLEPTRSEKALPKFPNYSALLDD